MKAKERTLLLLVLAAVILCAALFWLTKTEDAQDAGSLLCSLAQEDAEQLQLKYQGETLTLLRGEDGWTLLEDPAYHLDGTACDGMLKTLVELAANRRFAPQEGEDYGLEQPQLTVTLTAAGQSESFTFGAENPVTSEVYLSRAGESELYTVPYNKVSVFQKTKAELFGAFAPAQVTASELEQICYVLQDATTVSLTRMQQVSDAASEDAADYTSVWRLTDDPAAELDETKVHGLLTALTSYVSGQITHADPADYGFDAPSVTVTMTTAEKTARLTYASGVDGVYLMLDGDDSIYLVDLATLNKLLYRAEGLKNGFE